MLNSQAASTCCWVKRASASRGIVANTNRTNRPWLCDERKICLNVADPVSGWARISLLGRHRDLLIHSLDFGQTEDLSGMLDCLALKSRIASWSGDDSSATQADDMYMQLLADAQDYS